MALRFFNTLVRELQEFVPLNPESREVGVYCCGPTIHDFAHIGNFRTFIFADLVRRFLRYKGWKVTFVMNITDVEDKIIARVRQAGCALRDYTEPFERAFLEDLDALGCLAPDKMPRATEFVGEIIKLIKKLEAKGFAYQAGDGSVYFSIAKYREAGHCYGKLLHLNFEELRPGERVSSDEYEKESVADFALWKARVPEDGEVFWKSPWGEGRPGWHIECSAMSMKVLGGSFDIHLGGEDLVFPHHEDEIAQSEGAGGQLEGQPFVRYWLHGAHLLVEGKKMSKSLGNFFTLRDLLKQGFSGKEVRFVMLSAHYRDSLNFTTDGLTGARTSMGRIEDCLIRLRECAGEEGSTEPQRNVLEAFEVALDDNLNISKAWGVIFDWIRDLNRAMASEGLSPKDAASALISWEKMDEVLGLGLKGEAPVPQEFQNLLEERQAARKAKDFQRSDAIRDELKAKGWVIEDTPKGPRLKSWKGE